MNRLRRTFHGGIGGKHQQPPSTSERAWPANDDTMNERRRQPSSGRRGDRAVETSPTSPPPPPPPPPNSRGSGAGGSGRDNRRSSRNRGGGVESNNSNANAAANDVTNSRSRVGGRSSAHHHFDTSTNPEGESSSRRRRRTQQDALSPKQQQRRTLSQQQPQQQQQQLQSSVRNGNDNTTTAKSSRRSKKEIQSSVLAAIDALDTFKTYKPPLSASRIRYKKLGAAAALNIDSSNANATNHFATNATSPELHAAARPRTHVRSSGAAGSNTSNRSFTSNNPNSRQRRPTSRSNSRNASTPTSRTSGGSSHRTRTVKSNSPQLPQQHAQQRPSSPISPKSIRIPSSSTIIKTTPPRRSINQLLSTTTPPSSSSSRGKTKSPRGKLKSPNRAQTKSPIRSLISAYETKKSKHRAIVDSYNIPPRLQNDLQTRRRLALDVTCVSNEDGSVECDVFNLGSDVDPTIVYRCLLLPMALGNKGGFLEEKKEEQLMEESAAVKKKEEKKKKQGESSKPAGNSLGTNGWHRALDILHTPPPPFFEKTPTNKTIQSSPSSSLDQLTVTHILQHSHPQLDEYSAIQQEYDYLLEEIISLEKDRLVLEEEFDEVPEKMASSIINSSSQEQNSKKGKEPSLSYSTFRTNLRYMKSEDMKMLPVMWLEDVPLEYSSSPPANAVGSGPDNNDNSNNNNRRLYTKLDKPFQHLIRNHRGIGLALLISDPQCKTSLIGRCYMNSNLGMVTGNSGEKHQKSPPHSAMILKRNGAATLIDEGGEWLKHCAITGFDTNASDGDGEDATTASSGTTYFLKFDSGKTHHRGDLPSNLVARLYREEKEPGSIKYLSTGCSYSATTNSSRQESTGGRQYRCYYAEFDNGECWWGTNKDDVLDGIFMEMDVHRVAFGTSSSNSGNSNGGNGSSNGGGGTTTSTVVDKSSWVVIGKDGSVKWKNVPQGLHDVLIATQQENTISAITTADDHVTSAAVAPCEISLGIGGTYFIRFLDGRVDYSLPNFVADVFDKFEADGKLIRNVALHVDTYDCLIRYSKEMMSESS